MNLLNKLKGITLEECVVFALGVFSTFQLLELFGVTIFSLILLAYAIYICLIKHRLSNGILPVWLYMIIVCISECGLIVSGKHLNWVSASVKNTVLWLCVFIVYMHLVNKSDKYIKLYFSGVFLSCAFQVIWCGFQFICNKFINLNLNELVFERILHMQGSFYQIKNGILVLTGLTSNAGMMVPVLIFGMILSKKMWMKVILALLAVLIGSTTPIVTVACFMGLYILGICIDRILRKKRFSLVVVRCIFVIVIIAVLGSVVVLISNADIITRLSQTIVQFIIRISSIFTGKFTDGSTATHARYYLEIPYIYSKISLFYILFGYGISCAGIPFVELFNQYPDAVWVPESDFATVLFNNGLLGCVVFYGILIGILVKGKKVDYTYFVLMCTILISGLFYGIQTHWVLLSELLILLCVQRNMKANDIC